MQITQLKPGDKIPASSFTLEPDKVEDYIEAAEESSGYFTQHAQGAVAPPVVCASLAMAALLKDIELPDGAIHLSQEITLNKPARVGQKFHCHGSLIQNQVRGSLRIMSIRLEVSDEAGEEVLEGKTSFVLSEQKNEVS